MLPNKKIVIFKNLTSGFMDLKMINYIADVFVKIPALKEKVYFALQNDASLETNQAIMQMYNKLIGFNIFIAASSKGELLEYKELNELQKRHKLKGQKKDLDQYLKERFKDCNFTIREVERDIYIKVFSVLREEV